MKMESLGFSVGVVEVVPVMSSSLWLVLPHFLLLVDSVGGALLWSVGSLLFGGAKVSLRVLSFSQNLPSPNGSLSPRLSGSWRSHRLHTRLLS